MQPAVIKATPAMTLLQTCIRMSEGATVASSLFTLLDLLDREKVHYGLERTRPGSIQINAVFVGARVEIEVFEDGHIEMSKFLSNENVESGSIETVEALIADDR